MLMVIGRRLLQSLVTVFAAITLIFFLFSVMPGTFVSSLSSDKRDIDPAVTERIEKELGLNDPLPQRFGKYISGLATGDLG
ncbi:ABC transporter permease, partial [Escherichia coli]|nr:ABC transporter permease [Escherichia coli]